VESLTGRRLPEVAPLDVFRNAGGVMDGEREKNVKSGTPGERCFRVLEYSHE
jgi:hypothetical protein